MNYSDTNSIINKGFVGFKTISFLWQNMTVIHDLPGVYLVIREVNTSPVFLHPGVGGFFKGKDPNISEEELMQNWVEGSKVIYIGKAGTLTGNATLRSRLRQYLKFGQGKNIGHFGGRLIWQLADHSDLKICWMPTPSDDPRTVEKQLISNFISQYGKRPFANLTG